MSNTKELNALEEEIIFLKATNDLIDLIVNHEIISISHSTEGSQASPKTRIHQKLILIILVDFLSKASKQITQRGDNYLQVLTEICENPHFNKNNSIRPLKQAVEMLRNWLEAEISIPAWLPTINREVEIKITRHDVIYIAGNITKHNFSRLSAIRKKIITIFSKYGEYISEEEALLIFDTLYDYFFEGVFSYHASKVIELLNDIRWGIHDYLKPEYESSIVYYDENPIRYEYIIPK